MVLGRNWGRVVSVIRCLNPADSAWDSFASWQPRGASFRFNDQLLLVSTVTVEVSPSFSLHQYHALHHRHPLPLCQQGRGKVDHPPLPRRCPSAQIPTSASPGTSAVVKGPIGKPFPTPPCAFTAHPTPRSCPVCPSHPRPTWLQWQRVCRQAPRFRHRHKCTHVPFSFLLSLLIAQLPTYLCFQTPQALRQQKNTMHPQFLL